MIQVLVDLLHTGNYSCVVGKGSDIRTFVQRGLADLYDLYHTDPAFMQGAVVADKVVGKGAAALMIISGVVEVYADLVSTSARQLLEANGIRISWGKEVPFIINRRGDGCCPLEMACGEETRLDRLGLVVEEFVARIRKGMKNQ